MDLGGGGEAVVVGSASLTGDWYGLAGGLASLGVVGEFEVVGSFGLSEGGVSSVLVSVMVFGLGFGLRLLVGARVKGSLHGVTGLVCWSLSVFFGDVVGDFLAFLEFVDFLFVSLLFCFFLLWIALDDALGLNASVILVACALAFIFFLFLDVTIVGMFLS